MTDSGQPNPNPESFDPLAMFSYRGRIGRGGYFLGVLLELVLMFVALLAFASATNPTGGGGGPELAFVFAPILIWIRSLITIKRMRDAGKPFGAAVLFIVAPLLLIGVTIAALNDLYESLGPILLLLLALLAIPGLMPPKADGAIAS